MRCILTLVGLTFLSPIGLSATIYVPDDYGTIQAAISVSTDGDAIIVRPDSQNIPPGPYVENIDLVGRAITVRSEKGSAAIIIDGNQSASVVTFKSGEGANSVLAGFTVSNGNTEDGGGITRFFVGVDGYDSSPII